ncbi:hypothetical protein STENM223S_08628 [Streptomyces tendae]
MKLSTEQTVNTGLENNRIGSIGSRARYPAEQAERDHTAHEQRDDHPEPHAYSLPPQLVARISALAPAATSAMPR